MLIIKLKVGRAKRITGRGRQARQRVWVDDDFKPGIGNLTAQEKEEEKEAYTWTRKGCDWIEHKPTSLLLVCVVHLNPHLLIEPVAYVLVHATCLPLFFFLAMGPRPDKRALEYMGRRYLRLGLFTCFVYPSHVW